MDLSIRYIGDRRLPDKAIDLLDEATSSVKMRTHSRPVTLDKLEKHIRSLEIEREAIRHESEKKNRLAELESELSLKKEEYQSLLASWNTQMASRDLVKKLHQELLDLEARADELSYQ